VPHIKHNKGKIEGHKSKVEGNKGKVEGHKFKIQEIPDNFNPPSAPLDRTIPVDSHNAAATPIPETGAPSALPLRIPHGVLITPTPLTSTF